MAAADPQCTRMERGLVFILVLNSCRKDKMAVGEHSLPAAVLWETVDESSQMVRFLGFNRRTSPQQ